MESNINENEEKNKNFETSNEISPDKLQEKDEEEQFHESNQQIIKDAAKALEYKEKGNEHFKLQDTNQALEYYEKALEVCPNEETSLLTILYSNIAICYSFHKDYDSVLEYTGKALELNPSHLKSLLNRANALELQEKPDEALDEYKKILPLDPKNEGLYKQKMYVLEKAAAELMEKRKNEALDGLKKLGNTILNPFGISLDNFKMEKNENGSYNISFKK